MLDRTLLTGVTLIREGNRLGYPWKVCVNNMLDLCETVELAVGDDDDDGTFNDALGIAHQRDPGLRLHVRPWDMSNTGDGSELARQVNVVLPFVQGKWVLYLQADEFIHQEDHARLRQLLTNLDETHPEVTQVELWRTYFWGLNYRVPKYELYLGRVFKEGTHLVGGDGMHLERLSGEVYRSSIPIYHYSRVGTEEQITQRIRNLDRLFHEVEHVNSLPPFEYTELSRSDIVRFTGTHPAGILEFYDAVV